MLLLLLILPVIIVWIFREMYWKTRHLPPGTTPMIILTDYELMKETFVKDGDSYVDKFKLGDLNEAIRGGDYGIFDTNGEMWRDHRRFALHQLRDLGLGKNEMEHRILLEVDEIIENIRASPEQVELRDHIRHATASVINQLLVGYRFGKEHEVEFQKLMKLLQQQMEQEGNPLIFLVVIYSWTRQLPYFKTIWKKVDDFRVGVFDFFQQQIREHEKQINLTESESGDYVEAFLKEKKIREEQGDDQSFCEKQLMNMCFDLWTAGFATTAATLNWTFIYLLHRPDVQEKMQVEMRNVVGRGKSVTMADKSSLPYTFAVVVEAQRLVNLLPINVPHQTTKHVRINGYDIPSQTAIIAQISTLLYDKKIFPDPFSFKPERFLGQDGKFQKVDELIPFSIGKRQCAGEGLARMELFLVTANLVHRFTFSSANPPSMEQSMKTLMAPPDYECSAVESI